jgi:hypothetical protein
VAPGLRHAVPDQERHLHAEVVKKARVGDLRDQTGRLD